MRITRKRVVGVRLRPARKSLCAARKPALQPKKPEAIVFKSWSASYKNAKIKPARSLNRKVPDAIGGPISLDLANLTTSKVERPKHISWSWWFRNAVWGRRFINGFIQNNAPHNAYSWAQALKTHLPIKLPEITSHAPWLNSDTISYRRAINAFNVNGYYLG